MILLEADDQCGRAEVGVNTAWFIIQTERKTWTKYLVEAGDEEAAIDSSDNAEYLGYLDGDDTDHDVLGPFGTREEALIDVGSYVDGD